MTSLVTRVELQESFKRWLWDREDLSGMYNDFEALLEAQLNDDLRVAAMETNTSVTLSSGSGSLPTDYLSWRKVVTQDSPVRTLEWLEPDKAEITYAGEPSAPSDFFTIIGSTIRTYPPSSANLTLFYYQKIPSLASNPGGNWVTSRSPGLYLYGILMQAAPFLDDDERAQTWALLYTKALQGLQRADNRARYAKSAMRITGITP